MYYLNSFENLCAVSLVELCDVDPRHHVNLLRLSPVDDTFELGHAGCEIDEIVVTLDHKRVIRTVDVERFDAVAAVVGPVDHSVLVVESEWPHTAEISVEGGVRSPGGEAPVQSASPSVHPVEQAAHTRRIV